MRHTRRFSSALILTAPQWATYVIGLRAEPVGEEAEAELANEPPEIESQCGAMAFAFNMPRFIAFLGPLLAGTLIVRLGGYGYSAMLISCIYVLGFAAALLLPETRGKPLLERV